VIEGSRQVQRERNRLTAEMVSRMRDKRPGRGKAAVAGNRPAADNRTDTLLENQSRNLRTRQPRLGLGPKPRRRNRAPQLSIKHWNRRPGQPSSWPSATS